MYTTYLKRLLAPAATQYIFVDDRNTKYLSNRPEPSSERFPIGSERNSQNDLLLGRRPEGIIFIYSDYLMPESMEIQTAQKNYLSEVIRKLYFS